MAASLRTANRGEPGSWRCSGVPNVGRRGRAGRQVVLLGRPATMVTAGVANAVTGGHVSGGYPGGAAHTPWGPSPTSTTSARLRVEVS